ncbi:MAG: HAMP domain-containing protein, partial [Alphaproteobacteria bacterium]|nr:HAMP domain-containing protein [Alphaproteobacteria bacterium]
MATNSLTTFTIAKKLVAGFALAVILLVGLVGYNYIGLNKLAALQDEGAQRADDALVVAEASGMGTEMYQIIADGIINRELETTFADWAAVTEEFVVDMKNIKGIIDTPQEEEWAAETEVAYAALVETIEGKLFPLLNTSEGLTPEIAALDGDIDTNVGIIVEKLAKIMESIIEEANEADEAFDATGEETILVSEIVAGIATIALILIAVFTTRSIVNPINSMTGAMQKLAEGDLEIEVPARGRGDEIGKMAETVQVFKENGLKVRAMEAEQKEAEKRAEAEKKAAMNKMA